MEQCLEASHQIAWQRSIRNALGNLSLAHDLSGDYDTALACREQAIGLGRESGVVYYTGQNSKLLGHTPSGLDRPEEAAVAYREAVDILREADVDYLVMWHISPARQRCQPTSFSKELETKP